MLTCDQPYGILLLSEGERYKPSLKNSSRNFKKPIDNIKIKCYNINVKRLRNKGFDRTATTKN